MAGGDSVGARDGVWERFGAALYEPFLRRGERLGLAARRGELLRRVRGRVVEIGAGTGLNVGHYPATAEVVLTEPVPYLHAVPSGHRSSSTPPMRCSTPATGRPPHHPLVPFRRLAGTGHGLRS